MKRLAPFIAAVAVTLLCATASAQYGGPIPNAAPPCGIAGCILPSGAVVLWSGQVQLQNSGTTLRVRNSGNTDSANFDAQSLTLEAGGSESFIFPSTGDPSMVSGAELCWAQDGVASHTKDVCLYRTVAGELGVESAVGGTSYGALAEKKVATVTAIDWNVSTKTTLYTVPAGKSFILTRIVWRAATASATTASCGVGYNGAPSNDVIAAATHTALTGATLYSVDSAKAGALVGTAAAVLGVSCPTPQGGALTVTADVYGYQF